MTATVRQETEDGPDPEDRSDVATSPRESASSRTAETADRYSDARLAAEFIEESRGRIRYSPALGWLTFAHGVWIRDEGAVLVGRLGQRFGRRVLADAAASTEDPVVAVRAAKRIRSSAGIESVLSCARSVPGVLVRVEDLDREPLILNCRNGVVDLVTGELLAHEPAMLQTRQSPVPFDPAATCPRWERFLHEVLVTDDGSPDPDLVAFVHRLVGYCATAAIDEQVAVFLLGRGANGKSVLLSVLAFVLGRYAASADPSTFLAGKYGDRVRSDVARLFGARLVVTSEPELGEVLAAAQLKRMTGGDEVVARHLYQSEFSFVFRGKILFAANHPPAVRDDGEALWRRIVVVPFNKTFAPEERDPRLAETLKAEAPGILAWIVRGAQTWRQCGLAPPASVLTASSAYREAEDLVAKFVAEACSLGPGWTTTTADLFAGWRTWCEENGYPCGTGRDFGRRIADRRTRLRVEEWRTSSARGWRGIAPRGRASTERGSDIK